MRASLTRLLGARLARNLTERASNCASVAPSDTVTSCRTRLADRADVRKPRIETDWTVLFPLCPRLLSSCASVVWYNTNMKSLCSTATRCRGHCVGRDGGTRSQLASGSGTVMQCGTTVRCTGACEVRAAWCGSHGISRVSYKWAPMLRAAVPSTESHISTALEGFVSVCGVYMGTSRELCIIVAGLLL